VCVDASEWIFIYYENGILDGDCGDGCTHAVLAMGYGEENDVMFWKVKNSWGESWGEEGYIRILRTEDTTSIGKCGIAQEASRPNKLAVC